MTRDLLESPPTVPMLFAKNWLRYFILTVYMAAMMAALFALGQETLAVFVGGIALGVILRDLGAFRAVVIIWPASAAIIDRRRLDELLQEPRVSSPDAW